MNVMEPSTSASLLHRARTGDAEAWRQLVHVYGPLLYQWSRRSGLQSADAADATQDALCSVSKNIHRFDADVASGRFRGWLWTILRRRIADLRRDAMEEDLLGSRAGRLGDASGEGPHGGQPPGDEASQTAGILQRAVAAHREHYDPKTWTAFWATVVDGRAVDEVAESLGVSKWAIYKSRSRVLQRLRCELGGLETVSPADS